MPESPTGTKSEKEKSKVRLEKNSSQAKPSSRRMNREELSRHERETRAQRYILMGLGGVLVLIVFILAFGYWRTYISRGSDVVASVGSTNITLDQYSRKLDTQHRVLDNQLQLMQAQYAANSGSQLAQIFQQQIQQLQFTQAILPEQTLDQMIDEQLVRQEAAKRGITVTDAEIDQELNKTFGDQPTPVPVPTSTPAPGATPAPTTPPSPTATPGPSPTPVPTADVQANVNQVLLSYGLSRDELRSIMGYQVTYRKLQDAMGAEIPTTAEEVHARHILVDSEDKAKQVLDQLKSGAKFEDVAKAMSTDDGTKDKGGDLGWFPKGQMVPEFDQAAFSLPVGQLSDPVKTTYGYHVIQVLEKDPNHPLSKDELDQKKSQAVSDWLDKARTGSDVKRNLSDDDKQWVYQKIKWSPPALGQ